MAPSELGSWQVHIASRNSAHVGSTKRRGRRQLLVDSGNAQVGGGATAYGASAACIVVAAAQRALAIHVADPSSLSAAAGAWQCGWSSSLSEAPLALGASQCAWSRSCSEATRFGTGEQDAIGALRGASFASHAGGGTTGLAERQELQADAEDERQHAQPCRGVSANTETSFTRVVAANRIDFAAIRKYTHDTQLGARSAVASAASAGAERPRQAFLREKA